LTPTSRTHAVELFPSPENCYDIHMIEEADSVFIPIRVGEVELGLIRLARNVEPAQDVADYFSNIVGLMLSLTSPLGEGSEEGVGATLVKGGVVRIDPRTGRMRIDHLAEEEAQAEKQAGAAFTEIASSRKRAQKTQAEIDRLKKKTEAILDSLQ
jgi:hypothetical protein